MSEQIQQIPLEKITWPSQVRDRYSENDVISTALSMKAVGQLYPILVQWGNDRWIGIDGGTRWLAAKKLGWETIAAIATDGELCEGDFVHRQLSSAVRTDFKPLEKARATVRLMELTGWNATEAASRLGMSNAGITRLLALLTLPEQIAAEVEAGTIAASTAAEIAKISDPVKQAEVARQAAEGKLTRDGASGEVKKEKNGPGKPAKASASRAVVALGGGRSVSVSGEGLTLEKLIAWVEEFLSRARKARTQGWELAKFIRTLKDECKE